MTRPEKLSDALRPSRRVRSYTAMLDRKKRKVQELRAQGRELEASLVFIQGKWAVTDGGRSVELHMGRR